ncbi:hypothetical protein BOX15_Mlig000086g6, partial [Macrostomum lignano]
QQRQASSSMMSQKQPQLQQALTPSRSYLMAGSASPAPPQSPASLNTPLSKSGSGEGGRSGGGGKSETKVPKPPKPPEKPLVPYMRYSRRVWERVKLDNPNLKLWEVGKIIGQMWRELGDDEKQEFVEEYEADKAQYSEVLRQYHNSPQYLAWLAVKERAERLAEEDAANAASANATAAAAIAAKREGRGHHHHNSMDHNQLGDHPDADGGHRSGDPGWALGVNGFLWDDELDEAWSIRHAATVRYRRNHRLLLDVLSEARVPDGRQLVPPARVHSLRRQCESLEAHNSRLSTELAALETQHGERRAQMQRWTERFRQAMRDSLEAKPKPDFAKLLARAQEDAAAGRLGNEDARLAPLQPIATTSVSPPPPPPQQQQQQQQPLAPPLPSSPQQQQQPMMQDSRQSAPVPAPHQPHHLQQQQQLLPPPPPPPPPPRRLHPFRSLRSRLLNGEKRKRKRNQLRRRLRKRLLSSSSSQPQIRLLGLRLQSRRQPSRITALLNSSSSSIISQIIQPPIRSRHLLATLLRSTQ